MKLGSSPFVVAAAPVADQVDHDILVELLSVGEGQPGGPNAGIGVVAVDVQHRGGDGLGDVRAVGGGTRLDGGRGESHLVVDHDVDGAAGLVAAQLAHLQGFEDDPLAAEGRIAVQEKRQHREVVATDHVLFARLRR